MPKRDYYLPARRLVTQQAASLIEPPRVPRSRFITEASYTTAFNAGDLIPFLVEEVMPGDHLSYNVTALVRMATLLFPLYSNQRIETYFFFTPYRLVWTDFLKFMGEQIDPSSDISGFAIPTVGSPAGGHAVNTIYDYMGIPVVGQIGGAGATVTSALPFRAYNKIWNVWFRDQNQQNHVVDNLGNGPDNNGDYGVFRIAKFHDYFTDALPWAQKFTAPTIPLGGQAPITGIGVANAGGSTGNAGPLLSDESAPLPPRNYDFWKAASAVGDNIVFEATAAANGDPMIYADLTEATGIDINTFRQAFLVQQLLERDARGGTRYTEIVRSHFGVVSPDARQQRPEYIGGGVSAMNITPVAQTAPTEDGPLGALGATGSSSGTHRATYAATEHGVILGLIVVRSELHYQQGIHRMWSRQTRLDMPWPSLAQLGEQAVLRKEIYAVGDDGTLDNVIFGYQERYQELRTMYSKVTGIMRSTAAGTIDMWHLGQRFTTPPVLGSTFIKDSPPMDRVLAAGSEANNQQYLANIYITRNAVRPIPTYGTPAILGRF